MGETRWLLLLGLALAVAPTLARAQASGGGASRPVAVVTVGEQEPGAEAARVALEAHATSRGHEVVTPGAIERVREPGIDPAAVAELEAALAGLTRARELAARLKEDAALVELARTRRRIDALLALPGASRWAAEVEVMTAVVAHQAGASALAERSMQAAATLDPGRSIGSAEAPPELVARARAIAETVAGGPRGAFVLEVDAPAARAYVDDVAVESVAPRRFASAFRVVAPAGEHVLRIEAAGHRPYARRLDVYEGERAPVAVRLAPDPRSVAASRAVAAARRGDLRTLVAELARAGLDVEVWVAMASPTGARSLFARCDARGCARAEGLLDGRLAPPLAARAGSPDAPFADASFLVEPRPSAAPLESPRPRRRRALLWTAAGVALTAGAAVAIAAARPELDGGLRATIDFGELGRWSR